MRFSKGICTYPLCLLLSLKMSFPLFPLSPLLRRSWGTFQKLYSQDNSLSREQLIKVEWRLEVWKESGVTEKQDRAGCGFDSWSLKVSLKSFTLSVPIHRKRDLLDPWTGSFRGRSPSHGIKWWRLSHSRRGC